MIAAGYRIYSSDSIYVFRLPQHLVGIRVVINNFLCLDTARPLCRYL
jgi:hypothetical protein